MFSGCRYGRLSLRPAVRLLSVNTYSDISVVSGGISMTLGTSNQHVSGH